MKIVLNISDKVIDNYKETWFEEENKDEEHIKKEIIEDIACIVADRLDCPYIMDEHNKNIINYRN